MKKRDEDILATAASLDWIRKIDDALIHLDQKPQFALPSDFPLTAVSQLLGKLFGRPNIQIEHREKGWQQKEALFAGLGENLSVLTIEWTPIESPIYFVLSGQDLKELMGDLLGGEEVATPFFDSSLAEGFLHYLGIEILQKLESAHYLSPLSPRIGYPPLDIRDELKQIACFVSDISLALGNKHIWGRLFIPQEFRKQLNTQLANLPHLELSHEQEEKFQVDLIMEIGEGRLSLTEWKGAAIGDFILLDRCTYNPVEGKGSVIVKLGAEPIFRGRLKPDGIKLSDYPLFEEVEQQMEEEHNFELPEENEPSAFLTDAEPDLDSPSRGSSVSGSFVNSNKQDVENLPVHLTVEVGRVRMSLKELRQLAPGNLLELGVNPEQGVDLLVNGKKMGRGELIRMGETLGIRILSF